jgi:hypothetical protein
MWWPGQQKAKYYDYLFIKYHYPVIGCARYRSKAEATRKGHKAAGWRQPYKPLYHYPAITAEFH